MTIKKWLEKRWITKFQNDWWDRKKLKIVSKAKYEKREKKLDRLLKKK